MENNIGAKHTMDQKKKFPVILLIGIILVACIGIIGVGLGSYYLVDSYLPEILEAGQVDLPQDNNLNEANSNDTADEEVEVEEEQVVRPPATPAPQTPPQQGKISPNLFSPFWETRELLHDNFVNQPVDDAVLAAGAVEGIDYLLEEYEVSLASEEVTATDEDIADLAKQADTPEEVFETFLPLWQAWSKLPTLELPEEITEKQFMRAALQGMMLSLDDPYTSYLDPDLSRLWETDLSGEYEGIGAWVDTEAEFLTIISPIPGSPAEAAGLKAGDRVIKIDGDDMTGIAGDLVIQRVLGPAGSEVVITFARDTLDGTEEVFEVTIVRARIQIPNVTFEMLDGGVAYLQLITFSETAYRDLTEALDELLLEDPVGIVLDLRGNGGGYLHIAVNITSEFIEDGVLLYEEYGNGTRDIHEARTSVGLATEIPLVVLINGGSASASEILAGAVQDYERGLLVGTTTYGKGSVQVPIILKNGAGTARITIAKWLTPNENHIQNIGLEPDVFVDYTEENALNDEDPQLDKAVEILLGQ
jgi:carboxyl-terminal processing protease